MKPFILGGRFFALMGLLERSRYILLRPYWCCSIMAFRVLNSWAFTLGKKMRSIFFSFIYGLMIVDRIFKFSMRLARCRYSGCSPYCVRERAAYTFLISFGKR
jgi:hypothetical protein